MDEPKSPRKVWVVSEGSKLEGVEVKQIFSNRESALRLVDTLIAERATEMDAAQDEEPDAYWDKLKFVADGPDRWIAGSSLLEIEEWEVSE